MSAPTSDTPRQHQRVKRKQVQADDGWTVITHTSTSKSSSRRSAGKNRNAHKVQHARPTQIVEGLTVQKLQEELDRFTKRWDESAYAENLKNILSKRVWNIDNAVCIGIGSLSIDWENRYRSMWQLVFFMSVLKIVLKDRNNEDIKLYAQEPAFTSLDTEFLASLPHPIVAVTQSIEDYISGKSLVFAPFVDWTLLLPVFLKDKDPELYVGNEVLDDYKIYAGNPENEAARETCEKIGSAFLVDREMSRVNGSGSDAFTDSVQGLVVYWRNLESSSKTEKGVGVEELVQKMAKSAIQ
ncbi:hypothetical protein BU24DRAFT_421871 [Aaosphaeria arxii CBS 175.79]|uniref:SRR1-like domain-containing protein n=1 Tax=Aaosphaeria arxii CBS 175.79 TaxID=1450172 RepID=A0A6A5XSA8_9PLEO|nr:uncharacterized protein BU24DRAFT_421871 [Aaosphaeria arxii CBS 175.79]KAF2015580.1 hypothetical protein BU24DRAFT_421871 [Aaosphaeria arxii CBS 175.79]